MSWITIEGRDSSAALGMTKKGGNDIRGTGPLRLMPIVWGCRHGKWLKQSQIITIDFLINICYNIQNNKNNLKYQYLMRIPKILHFIWVLPLMFILNVPFASAAETKVTASDGAENDLFGVLVSISGDYAIVGASGDDSNTGSAYIFKKTGGVWSQLKKLTASDAATGDFFGNAVSISGDYAIVGAWGDDDKGSGSGSVYIFYKDQGSVDNWGQYTKLTASDGAGNDMLGGAVSISGNYAIAGAVGDNSYTGATYIFKNTGGVWSQLKKLTASDAATGNQFGKDIAISGDYAIIGAEGDDDNGSYSGSAYVFYKDQGSGDNWGQQKKLTAFDGATDDYFGRSVTISENYAIVGVGWDDVTWQNQGSVYIYYKNQGGANNWGYVKKAIASDGFAGDYFGMNVSLYGDYLSVGAMGDDDSGNASGSTYILNKDQGGTDNWGEVKKITASDGAAGDQFGICSLSGDYVLIGALTDDDNGDASGSAYFYDDYTTPECGDGVTSGTEQCDDGNITDGDGCSATCFVEFLPNGTETKIMSVEGNGGFFGQSTIITDGNYAVIGDTYGDGAATDSGTAYIFYNNGTAWIEQAQLIADDGALGDWFGISVSISGNYAVVGSFYDDDNGLDSGSAYLYQRSGSTWTQIKKLLASDGTNGDYFGYSVSINGDYIVVSAHTNSINPWEHQGAAYVFYKDQGGIPDSWGEQQKLTASDAGVDDYFGLSVGINGDYTVIGAQNDTVGATAGQGSAYVFHRSGTTWSQEFKITAADGAEEDAFGESVSINGDHIIIGAPGQDSGASESGAAYVFKRDGTDWDLETKIIASDAAANDHLGMGPGGVAINEDFAIVGSYWDNNVNGNRSGSAYLFKYTGTNWIEVKKFLASDGAANDYFGNSVSISSDHIIASARNDTNANGAGAGAAYIYDITVCGDGVLMTGVGELCDDGNTADGDGCDSTCQPETDFGCNYTFDELSGTATDIYCANDCYDNFGYPGGYAPDADHCFCVDQTTTQCDDVCASLVSDFGYTDPICLFIEPPVVCGDGDIGTGEECDDGNLINGDFCDSSCNWEGTLFTYDGGGDYGDEPLLGHLVVPGEVNIWRATSNAVFNTYDGNKYSSATAASTIEWACGSCEDATDWVDGIADLTTGYGGTCIPSGMAYIPGYRTCLHAKISDVYYDMFWISWESGGGLPPGDGGFSYRYKTEGGGGICGDGNLDAGEECDDGGLVNGDGCSATCMIEGACGALGEGEICISGEVDGGVALTAGSDITLSVDPANQSSGEDTDETDGLLNPGNTLTVWNNNVDGFDVTVALVSDDTSDTPNTLGIAAATDFLNGTDGTIKFKSTENAGGPGLDDLAGGTGVDTFALYTTDEIVYTNDNSADGICAAGTITVDHELKANVEVVPGSYTGTATYTIAVHV
jgi:cysteine-rich repeat protein